MPNPLFVVHEGRLLDLSTHVAREVAQPDMCCLALAAHGAEAAFLGSDRVVRSYRNGSWVPQYTLKIRVPIHAVACSADGRRVILTSPVDNPDWRTDVYAFLDGAPVSVDVPDFIYHVGPLFCPPEGGWGYSFLTSQPWSDYGSYVDRYFGVIALNNEGSIIRLESDGRAHDEEPRLCLSWAPSGTPFAYAQFEEERWSLEHLSWDEATGEQESAMMLSFPCFSGTLQDTDRVNYDTPPRFTADHSCLVGLVEGRLYLLQHGMVDNELLRSEGGEDLVQFSLVHWPELVAVDRYGTVWRYDASDLTNL